jgi:hypothetical protein
MRDAAPRRREIWLGDYVDAVMKLGIDDDETRREVADLLGLPWLTVTAAQPAQPSPVIERHVSEEPVTERARDEPRQPSEDVRPRPPTKQRGDVVITAQAPVMFSAPRWLGNQLPAATSTAVVEQPFSPLFRREWTRAILGALAAVWRAEHEIDVARLVEEFARRRTVTTLPRRRGQSVRLGTQFYIDGTGAMAWLSRDIELLIARARQVLGRDIRATHLDYDPRAMPLPTCGTPVVIVSDLGIAPLDASSLAAYQLEVSRSHAWRAAIEQLDRARCPIAMLVPFPPGRWPAWISRYPGVVPWDHRTTPAAVAHVVRRDRRRR